MSWSVRTFPWATSAAVIAALVLYLSPAAAGSLVYDRASIADGEWWRIFTAHWVHFSRSHLFWNLAVLIPAGIWSERILPARTRWLYFVAPVLIGNVLYLTEPMLQRYAGLSGVATAMLALLALGQLRVSETDRWFWRTVLGLIALKIATEAILASQLFGHIGDPAARAVALAHLAGVASAVGVNSVRRRSRLPK